MIDVSGILYTIYAIPIGLLSRSLGNYVPLDIVWQTYPRENRYQM